MAAKTQLQRLIAKANYKQAELARVLGCAVGTLSKAVTANVWPKTYASALQRDLREALILRGISGADIDKALQALQKNTPHQTAVAAANAGCTPQTSTVKGDTDMLLRKQKLTPEAKQFFALVRDPFPDDVQDAQDVFTSRDINYVRESMWACAKHGGMLAVVGESGAGKSTLRRDLIDRIGREQANMIVIEPYVLGMEENDAKGKTLKSAAIAESIIGSVNPLEKPRRSSEARFRQLHQLLKDSHRSGNKHVLIIEEAHGMPTATLKHLKRFFELEDGFKKLLSIILIGQPELRMKLSEQNAEVREVVQRIEVVELPSLDNYLPDFIEFKFKRVGLKTSDVIEPDAIEALRTKLTLSRRSRSTHEQISLLYPLAIANAITASINLAASIGAPKVSAEVIKEV